MDGFTEMDLPLDVQLDVDTSGGDLAEIAFGWLEGLSRELAGRDRAALAGLPARTSVPRGDPFGPLGEPGSSFGIVTVSRGGTDAPAKTAERTCSDAGLRWLREQLTDPPRSAGLWLGHLDERGHRSGTDVVLDVDWVPRSPGWLRLSAQASERRFVDPDTGTAEQRRWLDALYPYAEALDPGFGHIAYAYYEGATALEECLSARTYPAQERDPQYTIASSRTVLRGYAWLTVVPKELAPALGGVEAMAHSGAFAEVRPLAHGGLWLLATADYRDYDEAAVARVFHALAPVLRRGLPQRRAHGTGTSRPTRSSSPTPHPVSQPRHGPAATAGTRPWAAQRPRCAQLLARLGGSAPDHTIWMISPSLCS